MPVGVVIEHSGHTDGAPSITVTKHTEGATTKKIEQNAESGTFAVNFGGGQTATLAKSDPKWKRPLKVQEGLCVKMPDGTFKQMDVFGSDPY
jgi:hypothetical protein